jgi:hypothetical protein
MKIKFNQTNGVIKLYSTGGKIHFGNPFATSNVEIVYENTESTSISGATRTLTSIAYPPIPTTASFLITVYDLESDGGTGYQRTGGSTEFTLSTSGSTTSEQYVQVVWYDNTILPAGGYATASNELKFSISRADYISEIDVVVLTDNSNGEPFKLDFDVKATYLLTDPPSAVVDSTTSTTLDFEITNNNDTASSITFNVKKDSEFGTDVTSSFTGNGTISSLAAATSTIISGTGLDDDTRYYLTNMKATAINKEKSTSPTTQIVYGTTDVITQVATPEITSVSCYLSGSIYYLEVWVTNKDTSDAIIRVSTVPNLSTGYETALVDGSGTAVIELNRGLNDQTGANITMYARAEISGRPTSDIDQFDQYIDSCPLT